ncbi:non-muscle caldesmon isoform X2 [Hoplias malabaricus]|uniref:non-muscle caldesmon isoform X2 n=1 Tax=Hoplias malabaricus TaxID=27720 RepID=UPI0034625D50
MSSAIVRRNSSKQGLQNLLRVTAQRSIEDAEEIERERRRRAREALRKEHSLTGCSGSPQDSTGPSEDCLYESNLKPSSPGVLEEDEGFSDWTQRAERGRQVRQGVNSPREEDLAVDRPMNGAARTGEKINFPVLTRQQKTQCEVEDEEEYRPVRKSSEKRMEYGERPSSFKDRGAEEWKEAMTRVTKGQEEHLRPHIDKEKDKRQEVKVSYTSKVFLQQDRMPSVGSEDTAGEDATSQLYKPRLQTKTTMSATQASEPRQQAESGLETEQKLEKIRRSHQEKESQELEQLRQKQAEAEVELEELKKKREERRRVREEEDRRREEEEYHRLVKEEEEKRQMKEDIERRRMEAAEKRIKNLSTSSPDGNDSFSPKSSTYKITERTESLNRSLKKSNSFKKTQPPVLLSKIDDKLEQYTHAVEVSSKEPKTIKPVTVDMPSVPEPVAAKKNLFEAGEAWNQGTAKGTPSKETEGLKVGVADLITQWVKGSPEGGNRNSLSKPSDVKAGDVLQKKNMWEIIGEGSATPRSGQAGKGTSAGKRYKFVVTGHGKYEKISMDDDQYDDYPNGKSGNLCHNDL